MPSAAAHQGSAALASAPRARVNIGRVALNGSAGLALLFILLPLLLVTWLAFFRQEIPSFPPEGYSLKWFRLVPGNERFVSGFLLSLQIAVIATAIGLAIGVPAAVCLVRGRFTGREALNNLLLIDGDPLKNLGLFQEQGKHFAAIVKGGRFHKNRLN